MKNTNKSLLILLFLFHISVLQAQRPETVITTGHSSVIGRIALSPSGVLAATCSNSHLVKIWEVSSGKEICTLNNKNSDGGNDERIQNVLFFEDGKHLLTADENGKMTVWNIAQEKPINVQYAAAGMPGASVSVFKEKIVFFNKDYKLCTTGLKDTSVIVYPDVSARLVCLNPAKPNEVFLISASKEFYTYNLETRKKIQTFESLDKDVLRTHISPNGKFIAILHSATNVIRVWNLKTGELHKTISDGKILDFGYNNATGQLAVLHQSVTEVKSTIKAYNFKTYSEERVVAITGLSSYVMTLSKNGVYLAINTFDVSKNSVDLLNWETGKSIKKLHGKAHAVTYIGAASKVPKIAALSRDMNLRIWDLAQMQIEKIYPYVMKAAVDPSGILLAFQGYSEELKNATAVTILTLDSLKEVSVIPVTEYIADLHISADAKHIVLASLTGKIEVWDIDSKKKLTTIQGKTYGNTSIDISADNKYVAATASGLAGIAIYNLQDGTKKIIDYAHPILGASEIRFSGDSKYLLSGSFDASVMVWETGTWKLVKKLEGDTGPISAVCFDTKNTRVATAARGSAVKTTDLEVCAWEIPSGKLICRFEGHVENVLTTSFCVQKNLLYSGSEDGTIKIWDLEKCREVASCTAIGERDYIFSTPEYYYTGTKDALKGVGFKINGRKLYPFEQFDLRLNRPDIVASKIGLASPGLIKAFEKAYQKRLNKMGFDIKSFNNNFKLPEILIKNRADFDILTEKTNIALDIKAFDTTIPLNRINVWVNDVPVFGREGIDAKGKLNADLTINLELSEGKNKIQVSALNTEGAESLKETLFLFSPSLNKKPDLFLLTIGVSDYENDEYDLNFASKDAEDIVDLFKVKGDSFGDIYTKVILDKNAVKANILDAKNFLEQAKVNDIVVVFAAGHGFLDGGLDYFFATTDIDIENPEEKGLPYDELEALLEGLESRKKLLMLDACHSGEIDDDEYSLHTQSMAEGVTARSISRSGNSVKTIGLNNSFRLMQELFADLRRGSGAVVIASAGGVEYAFESEKYKNGLFTYVVINGVASGLADLDKNGEITVTELQDYVSITVSKITSGRQNPTARRENLEFDFTIFKTKDD